MDGVRLACPLGANTRTFPGHPHPIHENLVSFYGGAEFPAEAGSEGGGDDWGANESSDGNEIRSSL